MLLVNLLTYVADGSSDQCSSSKAAKKITLSTVKEETKFTHRYEEGYELSNPDYKA